MPELPEVETVVRTLEKQLGQPTLKHINVLYDKVLANKEKADFIAELTNEKIIAYHRIGKYMIFECTAHYLVVHMRMEGKFYIQSAHELYDKHTHVLIDLLDGRQLRYHDTRKFGRMYLYAKDKDYHELDCFKNVGYDVFDERLTGQLLYANAHYRKIRLKQFLLEQHVMSGVGNIYADEICYACALHPCTKVNKLSKKDCDTILSETKRILNGAIKAGGTTIRSYTSSLKVDGRFQLQLKVHMRKDQPCYRCKNTIEKISVAGRGTYFCKVCQKRK